MMKKSIFFILATVTAAFPAYQATGTDHSAWDQLLKSYVNDKNLVDYQGLIENKADTEKLHSYTDGLNKVSKVT